MGVTPEILVMFGPKWSCLKILGKSTITHLRIYISIFSEEYFHEHSVGGRKILPVRMWTQFLFIVSIKPNFSLFHPLYKKFVFVYFWLYVIVTWTSFLYDMHITDTSVVLFSSLSFSAISFSRSFSHSYGCANRELTRFMPFVN